MPNYILASHDSMTYLPPLKWWQKPFNFIARCQSKLIFEQFGAGARMFDIRVRFDRKGNVIFAHGLAEYRKFVVAELMVILDNFVKQTGEKIAIRLLLEEAYDDNSEHNERHFAEFCKRCEDTLPYIDFCGGYRKWDWKQIYKFASNISEDDIDQNHSSFVTSTGKRTWCPIPYIYAKLNNKKILKKGTDKKYLMIDFI